MIRSVCLAAALAGLAGCGLIASDVSEIDLDLPERQVIVDTADWALTDQDMMPAVACAETPGVCTSRVESWCGADGICAARCGGETCEVDVMVALWHTLDLTMVVPELQLLDGRGLVRVTIDSVTFTAENTLNMASPPLTVSVAPVGVISVEDDKGVVGIIPAIGSGETIAETDLELSAAGQTILAEQMRDYQTPFNLVVGGTVRLRAGDEVPSGRLVAGIKVTARARTGL